MLCSKSLHAPACPLYAYAKVTWRLRVYGGGPAHEDGLLNFGRFMQQSVHMHRLRAGYEFMQQAGALAEVVQKSGVLCKSQLKVTHT